jgi:hypothetical protein
LRYSPGFNSAEGGKEASAGSAVGGVETSVL